jgi:hypothetical protein
MVGDAAKELLGCHQFETTSSALPTLSYLDAGANSLSFSTHRKAGIEPDFLVTSADLNSPRAGFQRAARRLADTPTIPRPASISARLPGSGTGLIVKALMSGTVLA